MCYAIVIFDENHTSKKQFYGICPCGCGNLIFCNSLYSSGLKVRGEKTSQWKGGKFVDCRGIVYVKSYNHPFANKQGYVLEHRLVMEQKLGRFISPHEVVHHINKIKNDNRIENLLLCKNNIAHAKIHKSIKHCKLTKNDVIEIRKLLSNGVKLKQIADKFGVTRQAITLIKTKKSWGWVN